MKNMWFKIKKNHLSFLLAFTAKTLLRLILATCRLKVAGLEHLVKAAKTGPSILVLWHSRLLLIAEVLNKQAPQFIYRAVISNSRDGEPLAIFANSYKAGRTLRVRHDARQVAVSQMLDCLKNNEVLIITPDGPRGPKEIVKGGAAVAAKEAGAFAVPFTWEANRYWKLGTWDEMIIPKPFSKITAVFGMPVKVSPLMDRENAKNALQQAMDACRKDLPK